jgi:hypothetical protein
MFVAAPAQAELFDNPAARRLFERREAGESSWQVARREPLTVVVRTPGLADELFIEISGSGPGQWGIGGGSDRQEIGRAFLPPTAEPETAADRPRE